LLPWAPETQAALRGQRAALAEREAKPGDEAELIKAADITVAAPRSVP